MAGFFFLVFSGLLKLILTSLNSFAEIKQRLYLVYKYIFKPENLIYFEILDS